MIKNKKVDWSDKVIKTVLNDIPYKETKGFLHFKTDFEHAGVGALILSNLEGAIILKENEIFISKEDLKKMKKRERLNKEIGNLKEKVSELFKGLK